MLLAGEERLRLLHSSLLQQLCVPSLQQPDHVHPSKLEISLDVACNYLPNQTYIETILSYQAYMNRNGFIGTLPLGELTQ